MTTLDKTGIEAARDEFVHSTTKEQIERWAYKWADDLLSTADALSSLPAQAVGVKADHAQLITDLHSTNRWLAQFARAGTGDAMAAISKAIYALGSTIAENATVALAPSQPAAVGVTDEMVVKARAAAYAAWHATLTETDVTGRAFAAALDALEAALRSTP